MVSVNACYYACHGENNCIPRQPWGHNFLLTKVSLADFIEMSYSKRIVAYSQQLFPPLVMWYKAVLILFALLPLFLLFEYVCKIVKWIHVSCFKFVFISYLNPLKTINIAFYKNLSKVNIVLNNCFYYKNRGKTHIGKIHSQKPQPPRTAKIERNYFFLIIIKRTPNTQWTKTIIWRNYRMERWAAKQL